VISSSITSIRLARSSSWPSRSSVVRSVDDGLFSIPASLLSVIRCVSSQERSALAERTFDLVDDPNEGV
jgi:hypothetical protein